MKHTFEHARFRGVFEQAVLKNRVKILRKYGYPNYPREVCCKCGGYASEDSKTTVQDVIDWNLAHCGVCKQFTNVASPRDFGWPTFYTYENGAPVKGGNV